MTQLSLGRILALWLQLLAIRQSSITEFDQFLIISKCELRLNSLIREDTNSKRSGFVCMLQHISAIPVLEDIYFLLIMNV